MNSVVLVESQGSCALVRIARLQKIDRRDNMIFTVHLNRLIDENTPLEQSKIETCLQVQEAYKYQKVTKISCDIWSRFKVGVKRIHRNPDRSRIHRGSVRIFEDPWIRGSKKKKKNRQLWRACAVRAQLRA